MRTKDRLTRLKWGSLALLFLSIILIVTATLVPMPYNFLAGYGALLALITLFDILKEWYRIAQAIRNNPAWVRMWDDFVESHDWQAAKQLSKIQLWCLVTASCFFFSLLGARGPFGSIFISIAILLLILEVVFLLRLRKMLKEEGSS